MPDTILYYDRNAKDFVSSTIDADMSDARGRFTSLLPPGGLILDAGCGSGRDSIAFIRAGFRAEAFDASPEMCRLASRNLGFPVECLRFEDLPEVVPCSPDVTGASPDASDPPKGNALSLGRIPYDGIWACASLLHVPADDLPSVMLRLHGLLRPGGVLYASFKEGSGERVAGGRYFHDMTADSLRALLEETSFCVEDLWTSGDVRPDRAGERWVNALARSIHVGFSR